MTMGTRTELAAGVAKARIGALVADALESEWLRLHYQPIVRIRTGAVVGHEALLRIEHPIHGLLPPGVFLPEIEHGHVMANVGRWVIEESLRRTGARWAAGDRSWIALNVATRQLSEGDVAADLAHGLARSGLPPGAVHIELTETSDLLVDVRGRVELDRVAALGCPIWLDDFGTGYSSFSYLRHLPVTGIKIDRSFVDGIDRHARSAVIVSGLLRLAGDLGIEVVAEGVERQAEAELLGVLGCELAQGYRYGRPVAEETAAPGAGIVLQ